MDVSEFRVCLWREENGRANFAINVNSHGDRGIVFFQTTEDAERFAAGQPAGSTLSAERLTPKLWVDVVTCEVEYRKGNAYFEAWRDDQRKVWVFDAVAFSDVPRPTAKDTTTTEMKDGQNKHGRILKFKPE